jgi:hypothetical protein
MTRRIVLLACALLVALPPALARAHGQVIIKKAGQELQRDPVWVDPNAIPSLDVEEAAGLRRRIEDAGRGIYVAVLPADALHEARTAEEVLRQVRQATGRHGTYAVVVGGQFRAASSGGPERGQVAGLARRAVAEHSDAGIAATLDAFVRSVARARGRSGDAGGGVGGVVLIGLLVALAVAGMGGLALLRRRARGPGPAEAGAKAEARPPHA